MPLQTQTQQPITLADELGKGGEARIFGVRGRPQTVAKLYHTPTPEQEAKLIAMLTNPPTQPHGHTAIAWPTDLLYQRRKFVGFLMPKISDSVPLFNIYHPTMRRKTQPHFEWAALHRTALNLTIAVQAIHAKGHIIGDVNESNILVNARALVTFVDTDSFQVTNRDGDIYPCEVGKAEYTPPELQGVSFKTVTRTVEHDLFGLGVLLFQLLMEGFHPFAGVLTKGLSVGRVDLYCIKQGLFPYQRKRQVKPPPAAPPFEMLHPDLQAAFVRCFVDGHRKPTRRPTATEWQGLLRQAERHLTTCFDDPTHRYSDHLDDCPWCEREASSGSQRSQSRRKYSRPQPTLSPTVRLMLQRWARRIGVFIRLAIWADRTRRQISIRQWETIKLTATWGLMTFIGGALLYPTILGALIVAFILIKGLDSTRTGLWLLISLSGFWLAVLMAQLTASTLGGTVIFVTVYGLTTAIPGLIQWVLRGR